MMGQKMDAWSADVKLFVLLFTKALFLTEATDDGNKYDSEASERRQTPLDVRNNDNHRRLLGDDGDVCLVERGHHRWMVCQGRREETQYLVQMKH